MSSVIVGKEVVMRGKRALSAVAVVAALGLLCGCAQGPAAGDTAPPAARPSASSAPVAAHTGPVACDALATPDAVAALVGGTGAPAAVEHLQPGSYAGGPPWSTLNANGTVCGWGGLSSLIEQQSTPQVYLEVTPGLSAQWATLAAQTNPSAGSHYDGGTSLGGSCTLGAASQCTTDVLVSGAWLHVIAESYGRSSFTEQSFHEFVQGVVTRYAALPTPTPVVPHAVRDCADARLLDAVSAGVGPAQPDAHGQTEFSPLRAQLDSGQLTSCPFAAAGDPNGWSVWVSVLDGVDPALFAHYREAVDHPDSSAVDVSGLPGTAVGITEPTADATRTTVDVLTGSTWIELYTYDVPDPKAVVAATAKVIASGWVG
jgi:hypothetical protein